MTDRNMFALISGPVASLFSFECDEDDHDSWRQKAIVQFTWCLVTFKEQRHWNSRNLCRWRFKGCGCTDDIYSDLIEIVHTEQSDQIRCVYMPQSIQSEWNSHMQSGFFACCEASNLTEIWQKRRKLSSAHSFITPVDSIFKTLCPWNNICVSGLVDSGCTQTIFISFKMAGKEVVSAIDPVADSGCLTGRGGDK